MKYEIVPFEAKHWESLHTSDMSHAMALARGGPAYSALADGEVIAVGGVFVLWPGTGEAWCLVSPGIRKHGVFLIRQSRAFLKFLARRENLVRIQAAVQEDFDSGINFALALGFEYEGKMKQFFNGKTFVRFAKFYKQEG